MLPMPGTAVRTLCLTGTLIFAAGAALAQDPVRLARSFKKGDAIRAKYEVIGKIAGTEIIVSGKTKTEVQDVAANGNIVTVETPEETRLTVMGAEQMAPPEAPSTVTRDRSGRLLELKRDEGQGPPIAPEVQKLLLSLSEALLPEKAVAPGESWEIELDNPADAGKKVKVKTTFVGTEKVGEKSTWRIRQAWKAQAADAEITQDGTYWLDAATGHLVKREGSIENVPSQFGLMSWTERIERL